MPPTHLESLLEALHSAGAGNVEHYTHCSFVSNGTGRFKPTNNAQPYSGTPEQYNYIDEQRVEVVFPMHLVTPICQALHAAHPYQTPIYHIQQLHHNTTNIGAGMVGTLPKPFSSSRFILYLKETLKLRSVRYTTPLQRPIHKVALCGGSGSTLIQAAMQKKVDAFVTADIKYHDFFQADGQITIVDIGHYESEIGTVALLSKLLSKKFTNIALQQSNLVTNPIHYA